MLEDIVLKEKNTKRLHKVNMALEVTTRCYGNCSHCYSSCTPQGIDISFDNIKKINQQILKINEIADDYHFSIRSITGGDPFIYNRDNKSLLDIIKYLEKSTSLLDIHVSGWDQTPQFLHKLKDKNINYYISFTSFMPNSKKRIKKSVSDLEKLTNHLIIDIITVEERKQQDYETLLKLLRTLGYELRGKNFIKETKTIDVYTKEIFPYGRGENLVTSFPSKKNCSVIQENEYSYHYLDNKGNLYICARAGAKYTYPICNFLNDKPKDILTKFILFYNSKIIFNYLQGNTCEKCKSCFKNWTNEGWLHSSHEDEEYKTKLHRKINSIRNISKVRRNLNYFDSISLAYSFEKKGDLVKAREIFNKLLESATKESNYEHISEINKDISILDRIENKIPQAKKKLNEALKIVKRNKIKKTEANIYGNLGIISFLEEDYSKAIKFHKKSLYIHKRLNDMKRAIPNISFLGINYLFLGEKKRAKNYLFEALSKSLDLAYQEGIADSLYYLAIFYLKTENYFKSYIYAFLALDLYWRITDLYKYKQTCLFIINLPTTENNDSLVRRVITSYNMLNELFL